LIEHRSIVRLVRDTNYIALGPDDCVLQAGAISFDASTFEIWGALLNGGRLVIPPKLSILDPAELKRLITEHGVTTLLLMTSLFNQLVTADVSIFAGVRALLVGGERLSPPHQPIPRRASRHHRDQCLRFDRVYKFGDLASHNL
jgi:non-ribosomal peptide synthetase component F